MVQVRGVRPKAQPREESDPVGRMYRLRRGGGRVGLEATGRAEKFTSSYSCQ